MAFTSDGSRVCDSNRVPLAAINASYSLANKNQKIILCVGIIGVSLDRMRTGVGSLTLWWRRAGGTFAAITNVSEVKIAQATSDTVLVNGTAVTSANAKNNKTPTFIAGGIEVEAVSSSTASPTIDIRDVQSGEWQFALDFSGALDNQTYDFKCVVSQDVANPDITWATTITVVGVQPTVVQHTSGSSTRGGPVNNNGSYYINLPNGTQGGNCLVVGGMMGISTSVSITISDDKGNTWVGPVTVNDSVNGQTGFLFYALNVLAGTRRIAVKNTSGSAGNWTQAVATEFNNVALTSAGDGSNSTVATTATPSAGSMSPTVAGDLIYQVVARTGTVVSPSFTAGSQSNISWQLLSADRYDGHAAQWGVYTATVAINPTMTMGNSTATVSCCVALKTAAAGAPRPIGPYIRGIHHVAQDVIDAPGPVNTFQAPCSGNLRVAVFMMATPLDAPSTVTSSDGVAWNKIGNGSEGAPGSFAVMWYAKTPVPAPTLTITVTYPGALGAGANVLIYDIAGMNSATPFDVGTGSFGNQSGTPGPLTTDIIKPSTPGGVVLMTVGNSLNTANGLSGAGHLFDSVIYDGETDSGPQNCDQNNGWGHYYNPNTDTVTVTWTQVNPGLAIGDWGAYSASFKAPFPVPNPDLGRLIQRTRIQQRVE